MKEKKISEDEMTEERRKKLLELERQLGRHNDTKKEKLEKDHRLIKYFLIATNMMYTLAGPIIFMLGFLYSVEEICVWRREAFITCNFPIHRSLYRILVSYQADN